MHEKDDRKGWKPHAQKARNQNLWYPAAKHKFGVTRLDETPHDNERGAKRKARELLGETTGQTEPFVYS